MREAGVDLVTLGGLLLGPARAAPGRVRLRLARRRRRPAARRRDQRRPGHRDRVTAAVAVPPPPRDAAGDRRTGAPLWPGGRQAFCPSSPVYREHAARAVPADGRAVRPPPGARAVARRQRARLPQRPLLLRRERRGVPRLARAAVRRRRPPQRGLGHGVLVASATATSTRCCRRGSAPTFANPTQQLDFRRFCSDELLDELRRRARRAARAVARRAGHHELHGHAPRSARWTTGAGRREVDVVSNDHYLRPPTPRARRARVQRRPDPRRSPAGSPWLLMEHSTSAVNWQPRNIAKRPGEMVRNSLQHVARGADGVLFFQWRASRAGAEKFHSGAGPARRHRHRGCGARWSSSAPCSTRIEEVAGSGARNDVAMLFDWQAWWAGELDSHPTQDLAYLDQAHALHRALWDRGVGVDFVAPEGDLDGYRLVLVPTLYTVTDAAADRIRAAAEAGRTVAGHLLQRHRRRARPHPARRLPRRVPRPAGRVGRGVRAPARARVRSRPRRRHDRRPVDRAPAPARGRGRGVRTSTGRCPACPPSPGTRSATGVAWYAACRLDARGHRRRWSSGCSTEAQVARWPRPGPVSR